MERGIGIATVSIIQKNMEGTMDFFQELGPQIDNKDDKKLKGRGKHK